LPLPIVPDEALTIYYVGQEEKVADIFHYFWKLAADSS